MVPPQNAEPETGREAAPAAEEDPDDDKTWIDPDSLTWGTSQGGASGEIGWDAAPQQGWGSQGAAPQQGWGSQGAAPQRPAPAQWKPAASHEIYMDVNQETGRLEPSKKKKKGLFGKFRKS